MRYLIALALLIVLSLPAPVTHGHDLHPGEPIVFSGDGGMRTPLVALEGDYAIDWAADGRSILNVTLKSTELPGEDWLVRNVTVEGTASRRTYAYGLTRAHYYLEVTGSCPWSVTLTPLMP